MSKYAKYDIEWIELFNNGVSVREIARQHKCAYLTVAKRLKHYKGAAKLDNRKINLFEEEYEKVLNEYGFEVSDFESHTHIPGYRVWSKLRKQVVTDNIDSTWLDQNKGFINFLRDLGPRPRSTCRLIRLDECKGYSSRNCMWFDKIVLEENDDIPYYTKGKLFADDGTKPFGHITKVPGYKSWVNMVGYCTNDKLAMYKQYGAKGIKVCEEWKGSTGFRRFIQDIGPKPSSNHLLVRIDSEGDFIKFNCKWEEKEVFSKVLKTKCGRKVSLYLEIDGERKSLKELSKDLGISYSTLRARYNKMLGNGPV